MKKLDFLNNSKESKPVTKNDVKIRHNSSLYFQGGLIVAIFAAIYVVNMEFQENKIPGCNFDAHEESYFASVVFVLPENEPKEIKKEVKKEIPVKKPTDKIEIIPDDSKGEESNYTDTTGEPIPINPIPEGEPTVKKEDKGPANILGVERVPVFPGCEALQTNKERIECMSSGMGKLVQKRFNTDIASILGLTGTQKIYATFVINKNGEVDRLQIRAPHPQLERETSRVVKLIPKMIPGMQNDKNVDVMYTLPITFHIQ